jgi:integrative and conjugative element protein (TIGR02256 family)
VHFLNSWGSVDRRTLANFSDAVLKTFERNIQFGETAQEAGGILIGTVHGNHMLIKQATSPTAEDKRFRYRFERLPFHHEAIAASRWVASRGKMRYIGEWHTHPEDKPHPSRLDRSEWLRLAGKRIDKRPMLVVIVGRSALHVEIVSDRVSIGLLTPLE